MNEPASKREQRDYHWMTYALELASKAGEQGEVPVGAVVVLNDEVVGEGWNAPIGSNDPTAHAEIIALRHAADTVSNYRLPGATLYVTIEPCTMCVGAMVHARIDRLVFGAREPKAGAAVSQNTLLQHPSVNTSIELVEGVLAEECSAKISEFFASRREVKKEQKERLKQAQQQAQQ